MTAILLPNGKQQYFTTAGFPAIGYKVATFAAGTSTPQVTWQDALKVAQQTNPIILDGRGEASIFWDGAYKVQLQDSTGAVIWTQDNLQSQQLSFSASLVPAVTNTVDLGSNAISWRNLYLGPNNAPALDTVSGNIGYYARTAAEIAASVTPVNFVYAPGNVLRYGTNITPGTTDMTTAFQAALNAYAGQNVFVPSGIYKITSSLIVQSNTWLYGTGAQSQIIQNTNNIPILYVQGERTKVSDIYLAYPTLQTGVNTWGNGIHCGGPLNTSVNFYESIIERLYIFNANCGIYCGNKAISGDTNQPNFIYSCTIRDIRIANYGWQAMFLGVDGGQGNSGNVLENIYIINSNTNVTSNGVSLVAWGDGVINQLNIEHATHNGPSLVINNCDNLTINGLHFEGITVPIGNDFIGLVDILGSRVSITGLSVDLNFFNPATFYALFRLGGSGSTAPSIVLSNVIERGNTFGGSPTKPVFYFPSNNPTARLFSYTLNGFTAGFSGTGTLLQNENVFNNISAQGPLSLGAINTTAAATYSVAATDVVVIFGAACTVTLPTASANTNRMLLFKSPGAFAVTSASANVLPLAGGAAGTAILSAAGAKFAYLQSDGSNWNVLMAN